MLLTLKITKNNSFPIAGIVIKHTSPKYWLEQMEWMGLKLEHIKAYALPSFEKANELYGCLVIVEKNKVKNIGKNSYVQLVANKLFIPELTTIFPSVAKEEWEPLFPKNKFILLHDINLFELEEEIEWASLLEIPNPVNVEITKPHKGVFIPNKITSYRVEIDEEKYLEELLNPKSEEERINDLPFNMKKLLNGNQKEMEKYLDFLEKNPDKALQFALPLDELGTSRGDDMGIFSFQQSDFFSKKVPDFFSRLFNSNSKGDSRKASNNDTSNWGYLVVSFIIIRIIYFLFKPKASSNIAEMPDKYQPHSTHEVVEPATGSFSQNDYMLFFFIAAIIALAFFLLMKSKLALLEGNITRNLLALGVLLGTLAYVVYPIYSQGNLTSIFSILILLAIGVVLYRLFNSNKSILKDEK